MNLLHTDTEEIKLIGFGENKDIALMSVSKIYKDYTTQFFSFNLTINQVKQIHSQMGRFIKFSENPSLLEIKEPSVEN